MLARRGEVPAGADVEDLLPRGLLLRVRGRAHLPAEVEQELRGGRVVLDVELEPQRQAAHNGPPPVAAALRLLERVARLLDVLAADPPTPLVSGGLGGKALRRLAEGGRHRRPRGGAAAAADRVCARLVSTGQQAGAVTARGRRWRSLPEELA